MISAAPMAKDIVEGDEGASASDPEQVRTGLFSTRTSYFARAPSASLRVGDGKMIVCLPF
jgi:hypothetical protein